MKKRLNLIIIIFCLFFTASLDAQEVLSPDTLIGEWISDGTEMPKINDTITLSRWLIKKYDYTYRWTFSKNDRFTLRTLSKYGSGSPGIITYSENISIGYKWYYNKELNILKIVMKEGEIEQHFRIFMYQEPNIKLIMIK